MKYIFLFITILGVHPLSAQPYYPQKNKSRIFIVRHAEKEKGSDPALTTEGKRRAGDLVKALHRENIQRIYVTQFKRTQQTADSLRIQLNIDTVQVLADTSCIQLFEAITQHQDWNRPILIVTHSNIIQKIIYKLGLIDFPQQNTSESEFDQLYMIRLKHRQPVLRHTRYGHPSAASAAMTPQ